MNTYKNKHYKCKIKVLLNRKLGEAKGTKKSRRSELIISTTRNLKNNSRLEEDEPLLKDFIPGIKHPIMKNMSLNELIEWANDNLPTKMEDYKEFILRQTLCNDESKHIMNNTDNEEVL